MLNAYSEGKTTSTTIKAKIPSVHFSLEVDMIELRHGKKVRSEKKLHGIQSSVGDKI